MLFFKVVDTNRA